MMIIEKITLLTEEQFHRWKSFIPPIECWWWLTSPSITQEGSVRAVYADENLTDCPCRFIGGVRPFCTFAFDASDSMFWHKPKTLIGSKFNHGKHEWTILDSENGRVYAVCNEIIAKRCFAPEMYSIGTNDWEACELKRWLETEGLKLITT